MIPGRPQLPRRSRKRAAAERIYAKLRRDFLERNPWCSRCGGESEQVHHRRGRVGGDLLDVSTWLAVCASCHSYITAHPREAMERGWSLPRTAS